MRIAGIASIRNIHCQPAQPWAPDHEFMIQPDSGPPKTPDIGMAVMNMAMILPRRAPDTNRSGTE